MTIGKVQPLMLAGGDPCEGYQIGHSVRLNSADTAHFVRTPAGAGNRKKWALSVWAKRNAQNALHPIIGRGAGDSNNQRYIYFNSSNNVIAYFQSASGVIQAHVQTAAMFRDPSAHVHVHVAYDSTQATASERLIIEINGVRQTDLSATTYPALNLDSFVHEAIATFIGRGIGNTNFYADCQFSEFHLTDGIAPRASEFGFFCPITGQWRPKKYTGSYGTNGFYLDFSDGSAATATTLGADRSGNGNNWTPVNISVTPGAGNDWLEDTPSNNFCTLNPLDASVTSGGAFIQSNANLRFTGNRFQARGTHAVRTGKWYFEFSPATLASGEFRVGVSDAAGPPNVLVNCHYESGGTKVVDGVETSYGASFGDGDVIGVAFDADAKTAEFFKNNLSQGVIGGLSITEFSPAVQHGNGTLNSAADINFGQRPFAYTPPAGFKALCTKNLPAPLIVNPKKHFDVALWAGNDATQDIGGLAFQPDLAWIKSRSDGTAYHALQDSVRGSALLLSSNATLAEQDRSAGSRVDAFLPDGLSLVHVLNTDINAAGQSYVAWNWRRGALPGFDIVAYTGTGVARTVPHALGDVPKIIIAKCRSIGGIDKPWAVYHTSNGADKYLLLNATDAVASIAGMWGAGHSSTHFGLGGFTSINTLSDTYIAYLFAEVSGFSKFGSYTGNGSVDGPFVHCGFRPAFVMMKRVDAAGNWHILDVARDPDNLVDAILYPNDSAAENIFGSSQGYDFISNGFKVRTNAVNYNASGGTYIYMAFAEAPFKYANAR